MLKKYLFFIVWSTVFLYGSSIDCELLRHTNKYLKECNFYDASKFIRVTKDYNEIAPISDYGYDNFVNVNNSFLAYEKTQEDKDERIVAPIGWYTIKKGDIFSFIAQKFSLKTSELLLLNKEINPSKLKVGKKLKIPLSQEKVDVMALGKYKVKPNDTLLGIAYKFKVDFKRLLDFNDMERNSKLKIGKILEMPFPYILKQFKARKRTFIHTKGKHRLRVTATAYTSHAKQTDKTPFLAAWNNRIKPGMKIIAVSRDLLSRYGMKNGTKVWIGGLRGYYRVRDKMNKRYKKRIDIYMGMNRKRALKWGKKSVVIYWK